MNVGFKESAAVRILPKAELAERNLPLIWHAEFKESLECVSEFCGTFLIPKGFITDGASIPSLLWAMLSDTSPDIMYPSFGHDFLYSIHGNLPKGKVTRDQADNLLREQMLAVGASRWKANACYRAVHIWGPGSTWNQLTPMYKLAKTSYSRKPKVRRP